MSRKSVKLEDLCVEIIENTDVAAVTPGVVRQRLEVVYGRECGYSEIFDLLHQLETEGRLVYHNGEYNEFSVPENATR